MTDILLRTGTPPAATSALPTWDSVHPLFIAPNKLKIGDDLKGASVAFDASRPSWDKTVGGIAAWTGSQHTRYVDGTGRSSTAGRRTCLIDPGVADVRVLLTIAGATVNSDNPAVIFRYVDDNNYWFFNIDVQNNIMRLSKFTAGVQGNPAAGYAVGGVLVQGGVYEVRAVGNTIQCYVNGILYGTATDAAFNTATKCGFSTNQQTSVARFTNFMAGNPS